MAYDLTKRSIAPPRVVIGDRGWKAPWPSIDIIRTSYSGLPRWLRRGLTPAIKLAPASWRYGASYRKMRADIDRSRIDPDFVEGYQIDRLRALFRRGYEHSAYCREIIERAGGADLIDTLTPADLARFPVLPRDVLERTPEDLLVAPLASVEIRQTSGSSSRKPIRIFLDRDRSVREMAFVHSLWAQMDFKLGSRILLLRDGLTYQFTEDNPIDHDGALNEIRLSPYHMTHSVMDLYLARITTWAPSLIYGLPSALTLLAHHALLRDWRPPADLTAIFTSSETLFAHQRAEIERAFGKPVRSYYGLTERTAFAGEEGADVFSFEPLYGVAELVDRTGNPVRQPGTAGRVITTGFLSQAMALIRYDSGDAARLVEAPSSANGWRLKVTGIRSKWSQEYVIGRHGNPFSVLNLVFQSHLGLIQDYQFLQDTPGEVVFKVVLEPGVVADELLPLLGEMRAMFGDVMTVRIEPVEALPPGPSGKRRLVDQRLPLPCAVSNPDL